MLNRNQIKYLAVLAMVVDHFAWAFVPTYSLLGQGMHFIGRLTGPVMAFFLAEGYVHTRSVKKYALRLGVFALISWAPCALFEFGRWLFPFFGVIYTLFLGLAAIWIWDKSSWSLPAKGLAVCLLCVLSWFGDWPVFDVLWPLYFFLFRDDEKKKWRAYYLIAIWVPLLPIVTGSRFQIFQFGVLFVPLLLRYCYNGKGGSKAAFHKWFFFVFYPAHLMLLWLLKTRI